MRKIEVKSNEELIEKIAQIKLECTTPETVMVGRTKIVIIPIPLSLNSTEKFDFAYTSATLLVKDLNPFPETPAEGTARKAAVDRLAEAIAKIPENESHEIVFGSNVILTPGIEGSLSLRQRTKEAYSIANAIYDQFTSEPTEDTCSGCQHYFEEELGINLATLTKKTNDLIQDEIDWIKSADDTSCVVNRLRQVKETFTEGEMVNLAYSFINSAAKETMDMAGIPERLTTREVINIIKKGL